MATRITFERPPDAGDLGPHLYSCASRGLPMVEKDRHLGENALICSTGPSIMDDAVMEQVKRFADDGFVVFGLKESIPYLRDRGVDVAYSVSMDPGGDRQVQRTPIDTSVTYCVASSCHPKLFDHLLSNGCRVEVFHSACGYSEPSCEKGFMVNLSKDQCAVIQGEYEMLDTEAVPFCPIVPTLEGEVEVYQRLFNNGDAMQGGFTVTNRTIALTKYFGFERTVCAGTDFGWRDAGGCHYSKLVHVPALDDNPMCDSGVVDGVPWFTRPDQLASAVDVARKVKKGEVEIIGDSLALALSRKDDDFLDKIIRFE